MLQWLVRKHRSQLTQMVLEDPRSPEELNDKIVQALQQGSGWSVVSELLEAKADILFTDPVKQKGLLHYACMATAAGEHDKSKKAEDRDKKNRAALFSFWDSDSDESDDDAVTTTSTTSTIALLIEGGVSVNAKDADQWTPLHQAASSGNVVAVTSLVRAKATLSSVNTVGRTALHIAASLNHDHVVRVLLRAKADANARDKVKHSPLHWAAANNCVASIQALLANSSTDINAHTRKNYATPLYKALTEMNVEAALALLDKSPALVPPSRGPSLLHLAANSGSLEVALALLRQGVEAGQEALRALAETLDLDEALTQQLLEFKSTEDESEDVPNA